MPFMPRLRLPRRRPTALSLRTHDHDWFVFTPEPDHPLVVAEFGDAVSLATDITDLLPARRSRPFPIIVNPALCRPGGPAPMSVPGPPVSRQLLSVTHSERATAARAT